MERIGLEAPLSQGQARKLKAGMLVDITGTIWCARDMAHKYFSENAHSGRPDITGSAIFHCGPLVRKEKDGYRFISAGPTTSMRMGRYLPEMIRRYSIRMIIGKGGLDRSLLPVLNECGCIYVSAIGGLGALTAERIREVMDVFFLEEFGPTEAVWKLRVEKLPGIVTMDTGFSSLHDKVLEESAMQYRRLTNNQQKE